MMVAAGSRYAHSHELLGAYPAVPDLQFVRTEAAPLPASSAAQNFIHPIDYRPGKRRHAPALNSGLYSSTRSEDI